jgi:ubiquinone/menaquinone biosynthesis C-methylase UbiE
MIISTVHRTLSFAPVYRGFQLLFGADRARRKHVAAHIRPSPGDFVVDLGCGPGDILDYLPNVRYLGFDVNPAYIKAALSSLRQQGRVPYELSQPGGTNRPLRVCRHRHGQWRGASSRR